MSNNQTNRDKFEKLPKEDKAKIIKSHLGIYKSAVNNKMKTLTEVAAISSALIIVATLNQELIPLRGWVAKLFLSIFLVLIPLSLFIYTYDQEQAAQNAIEKIESYTDSDYSKNKNPGLFSKFAGIYPYIVITIYTIIVLVLLYLIWK